MAGTIPTIPQLITNPTMPSTKTAVALPLLRGAAANAPGWPAGG
jgi:hypothetical protein